MSAIGIMKRSVRIGKKILSIKEIKYKNLDEFLFFTNSNIFVLIFFIFYFWCGWGDLNSHSLTEPDFESGASTSSATPAIYLINKKLI